MIYKLTQATKNVWFFVYLLTRAKKKYQFSIWVKDLKFVEVTVVDFDIWSSFSFEAYCNLKTLSRLLWMTICFLVSGFYQYFARHFARVFVRLDVAWNGVKSFDVNIFWWSVLPDCSSAASFWQCKQMLKLK